MKRTFQLLAFLGASAGVRAQSLLPNTGAPAAPSTVSTTVPQNLTPRDGAQSTGPMATNWNKQPKIAGIKKLEVGPDYGNVIINNNCDEPFYVWSVGSWYLGGDPLNNNNITSTPEDQVMKAIQAGETYIEPYRTTCVKTGNITYCADEDKLAGQGISVKISRTVDQKNPTQLEYALKKSNELNQSDPTAFYRLWFDISMLDCASPPSQDTAFTDDNASQDEHQLKVDTCPGYQGGVGLTWDNDQKGCQPLFDDGTFRNYFNQLYMWDRTHPGAYEASLGCASEYKGNMTFDLCLRNNKTRFDLAFKQRENWLKIHPEDRNNGTRSNANASAPVPSAPLPMAGSTVTVHVTVTVTAYGAPNAGPAPAVTSAPPQIAHARDAGHETLKGRGGDEMSKVHIKTVVVRDRSRKAAHRV